MNYLADTNIIVFSIFKPTFLEFLEQTYLPTLNRILISTVTEGELKSLAIQRRWGDRRKQQLLQALQKVIILPIKVQSIIEAYAQIDAYSQGKLKGNLLPKGLSSRNMGKNDLWIAATAHVTKATLITTDKDFEHLDGVFFKLDRVETERYF